MAACDVYELLDVRDAPKDSQHTQPVSRSLLSRALHTAGSVRVTDLLTLSCVWAVVVVVSVLAGVCFYHRCKKLQTVSYAADREPMTTMYSMGITLFIITAAPCFHCLHVLMRRRLALIEAGRVRVSGRAERARPADRDERMESGDGDGRSPAVCVAGMGRGRSAHSAVVSAVQTTMLRLNFFVSKRVLGSERPPPASLRKLLGAATVVFAVGLVCMFTQCMVPLHVSKPLHNQSGFAFLFLAACWVNMLYFVLYLTRASAADDAVLRAQSRFITFLVLAATGTVVQASFAYSHRSFFFNSRILAVFEAITAIGGCLYPLTFNPILAHMYIDTSCDARMVKQLGVDAVS